MWDEEDGFYYDILRLPDGTSTRLKVRSLVGLLPICAATVFHGEVRKNIPEISEKWPASWKNTREWRHRCLSNLRRRMAWVARGCST